MNRTVSCPTCGRRTPWDPENRWRPFCCERCKLIDLGQWADESHRIAGEPAPPEVVEQVRTRHDDER